MDNSNTEINAIKLEEQDEEWNSNDDEDVKPEILDHDQTKSIKPNQPEPKIHKEIEPNDVTSISTTKRSQCTHCPKSYKSKYELKKHIVNIHIDEKDKPFQCKICLSKNRCKKFIDEKSLNKHMKIMHSLTKSYFKCKYCFRQLSSEESRVAHQKNVHGPRKSKPFQCKFCLMRFNIKSCYETHLIAKHRDVAKNMKFYKCEICSKEFGHSSALVRHALQDHVVDKPFECQYCSKAFMKKYELTKHARLHDNKTSFSCDLCSSHYRTRSTLRRHLGLKHHKFFYCNKCKKSFATEFEFDQHAKTVKEEEVSVTAETISENRCKICHEFFSSNCSLNIHKENIHLVTVKTEPEENESTRLNTNEQMTNKFQCELCSKSFDNSRAFVSHRKYAHENSEWQCKVCLKSFKLRSRLNSHEQAVHVSEKLYKCDVCQSAFKYQHNLTCHKKTHLKGKRRK